LGVLGITVVCVIHSLVCRSWFWAVLGDSGVGARSGSCFRILVRFTVVEFRWSWVVGVWYGSGVLLRGSIQTANKWKRSRDSGSVG
jgi:hypothetical protein